MSLKDVLKVVGWFLACVFFLAHFITVVLLIVRH